ncbi:MAG: ketoacyl-ACP synthase III, partial [Clostridium sp.]|nr:ketoacyl-ACP synthase III [Clostridium sp.]
MVNGGINNGLTVDDIAGFCFSQYVWANNKTIMDELGIPEDKCPFVGKEYGYTGANSPFIALSKYIQEGKVHHGDYLVFWTIGSAMQHIILLVKF